MEIPKPIASELKNIQNQLKLAIQAHQIMLLKHKGDPENYKLSKDLRDVVKHIISLGEKQNCLIKWLRKELKNGPANSALIAKTVASSLGFGEQRCNPSKNYVTAYKKCLPPPALKRKNNSKAVPPVQNKGHSYNTKMQSSSGPKKKSQDDYISYKNAKEVSLNGSKKQPRAKPLIVFNAIQRQADFAKAEECSHYVESCLAEKVKFLSAVGLVTREVLSELQNRRVERKRRSTANHTQFVYGSNWEVTTKKRKKNNYLVTNAKHVTRQTARAQHADTENSQIPCEVEKVSGSILETCVSASTADEKAPQSANPTLIIPLQKTLLAGQPLANCDGGCSSGELRIPGLPASLTIERVPAQTCAVCHKAGNMEVCGTCNVNYHLHCGEESEKCLSCGIKIATIRNCQAEKSHLQEVKTQLNTEKEELETRAAELSVSLAVSEYVAPHQNAYVLVEQK